MQTAAQIEKNILSFLEVKKVSKRLGSHRLALRALNMTPWSFGQLSVNVRPYLKVIHAAERQNV